MTRCQEDLNVSDQSQSSGSQSGSQGSQSQSDRSQLFSKINDAATSGGGGGRYFNWIPLTGEWNGYEAKIGDTQFFVINRDGRYQAGMVTGTDIQAHDTTNSRTAKEWCWRKARNAGLLGPTVAELQSQVNDLQSSGQPQSSVSSTTAPTDEQLMQEDQQYQAELLKSQASQVAQEEVSSSQTHGRQRRAS